MLRDKSLIPLSHQHQRALALCVRIDRAQPLSTAEVVEWQSEIEREFEDEIKVHFAAEEEVVFPAASRFSEFVPLIKEFMEDHASLRIQFSQAEERKMSAETMLAFAQKLSAHIRKEERQLFEGLQRRMSAEEPVLLGVQLEGALKDASYSCGVKKKTSQQ